MWVILSFMLITTAHVPLLGVWLTCSGARTCTMQALPSSCWDHLSAPCLKSQFHGRDLVLYRIVQDVGGAMLFANCAAIVTDAFRKGRIGLGLGVNQIALAAGFLP